MIRKEEQNSLPANLNDTIDVLLDNIPFGVVLYEFENGTFTYIYSNECYRSIYKPLFSQVNSSDCCVFHIIAEFKNNVNKLNANNERFEKNIKIFDNKSNKDKWIKVITISKQTLNGQMFVYVFYDDVTTQVESNNAIKEGRKSLIKALDASNVIGYEYDPLDHSMIRITNEDSYAFPKTINEFPSSIKNTVHPDDFEKLNKVIDKINNGTKKAQCDIRIMKNGEYRWFSCNYNAYYNQSKSKNNYIAILLDITLRISVMDKYEKQLSSLLTINDYYVSTIVSLTYNKFVNINTKMPIDQFDFQSISYDETILFASKYILGKENQRKYVEIFSSKSLMDSASKGKINIEFEYLIELTPNHFEWTKTYANMVRNPITNEVMAVIYSKSTQQEHMTNLILEKIVKKDYIYATFISIETGEFYLYNAATRTFSEPQKNFWETALVNALPHCTPKTNNEFKKILTKENIVNHLNIDNEFVYTYDFTTNDKVERIEVKFVYDETKSVIISTLRNITDETLLMKIKYDSEHDALTGLYNRKKFVEEAKKVLEKKQNISYALVRLDVKKFDRFVSFFGEEQSNKLLCDLADLLRLVNKDYDNSAYGRFESDIFCELIPYNRELFKLHGDKTIENLRNNYKDFVVEPKIGIYVVEDINESIESMFAKASIAAKFVSENDTNYVMFYDKLMEQKMLEEEQLISEFYNAIKEEQFEVYLQPKYSLITETPIGAEALVRWNHPTKGIISPAKFIPIFEKNGYIADLDYYMWDHVCKLLSKWKNEGKKLLPISVNMSRVSLYKISVIELLKKLIKQYDIDPKYFELELTESAYVENVNFIKPILVELKQFGFTILMDDFGSGYSSLNSIKDLPVDILKLDMKFLSKEDDERGNIVISSIINMSKLLDLKVIAEGVETKAQAIFLKGCGCEIAQGYLYAKPMQVLEYEKLLKSK